MRCIMVMFDSLNRHMLPPYAAEPWVHAPNFRRLADRAVTFDTSYVGSMPCMPARRELHTGRPNFLHTDWGQLEPYDDSVPAMLSEAGVYTHLATDHQHYFEDGGATYHGRYDSWEFYRGQEGDPHTGQVADPPIPENVNGKGRRSDWVNRQFLKADADYSQTKTFDAGERFIEMNHEQDRWFLQIECFDPHEPFTSDATWREHYPSPDDPEAPLFDWPPYGEVTQTPAEVERARRSYAALMTKCDHSLGRVMDLMDKHGMWDDTMLIVWTDHGFLLGEHNAWAKNWPPLYEEISHTPFFIHDPRRPETAGQRRDALVQPAVDLGPTLLRFFDLEPTQRMLGHDLAPVLADDTPVRDDAIFGYHNHRLNYTDGRYCYYRVPRDTGVETFAYTLACTSMRGFKGDRVKGATLAEPFDFTRGHPLLKVPAQTRKVWTHPGRGDLLYDLQEDPDQQRPLDDAALVQRIEGRMATLMARAEAPDEQYTRMGLEEVRREQGTVRR